MIVKIQRPLESTLDTAPALIYNQDKSVFFYTEFTPVLALAMGSKLKVYCEAEIQGKGIRIIREVESQPW